MNRPTGNDEKSFEESAEENSLGLLAEFFLFLRENKAWWMIPILLMLLVVFGAAWLTSSPVLAPFIYPLF